MLNEKARLMNTLSAEQFAAWELHLFLDTHPNDVNAKRLYMQHSARAAEIKAQYEQKFGPITSSQADGCEWINTPWPWEKGE